MVRLFRLIALFVLSGCASHRMVDDDKLAILYNDSAQYEGIDRNPVIVIPGILGSKLKDQPSDTVVWGAFVPGAADPQTEEGVRLIALPLQDTEQVSDLKDETVPDGVLETVRVRLLGIPLSLKAYAQIISALGAGGYRDQQLALAGAIDYGSDHFTCFQFSYDWRLDNAGNAARLLAFIKEKKAFVREEYKQRFGIDKSDIKFDIVAHSMGGLLTRYMLRYGDQPLTPANPPTVTWAGAKHVERVFLVGTPNYGSTEALTQLIDGKDLGMPFLPFYQPTVLGSFPSIYQLLPRPDHGALVSALDGEPLDFYNPALWQRFQWGLADPGEEAVLARLLPGQDDPAERRRLALKLQGLMLRQAEAFHAALDRPAEAPEGLQIYLIAGDGEQTVASLAVDAATGRLSVKDREPGDGTVLRRSVLADHRPYGKKTSPRVITPIDYHQIFLLPDDHIGLVRSEVFQDNILFWLLEDNRGELLPPQQAPDPFLTLTGGR